MSAVRRLAFRLRHPAQFKQYQLERTAQTPAGYSYRPFDEHRCIFVHIPKCAGVSVCTSLFGNLAGGHATMRQYELIFTPSELRSYFKFTIVRNPWDRLVSSYFFLKAGGMNDDDKRWASEHLEPYADFDSFVRRWLNERNIRLRGHFWPQSDYICLHPGKPAVDFIGYFERLPEDFAAICERLNIRASLPNLNHTQTKEHDYRRYYSDETRRIVASVYAEDVRMLGYSFEGFTPAAC